MTQFYDKSPYTHRKIQKATWQHKNATKNIDYITIADILRTVSWSNSSHPTNNWNKNNLRLSLLCQPTFLNLCTIISKGLAIYDNLCRSFLICHQIIFLFMYSSFFWIVICFSICHSLPCQPTLFSLGMYHPFYGTASFCFEILSFFLLSCPNSSNVRLILSEGVTYLGKSVVFSFATNSLLIFIQRNWQ